jgi:hypothetical protein
MATTEENKSCGSEAAGAAIVAPGERARENSQVRPGPDASRSRGLPQEIKNRPEADSSSVSQVRCRCLCGRNEKAAGSRTELANTSATM